MWMWGSDAYSRPVEVPRLPSGPTGVRSRLIVHGRGIPCGYPGGGVGGNVTLAGTRAGNLALT